MRRFFVVTPVLNGERFIEATLASVDAQTWPEWTHYVVDGGSGDRTVEIVQRSLERQPRRRLLCGPDRGMYDGVLKGFAQARADGCAPDDVVLWLNADDMLAPWAFATLAQAYDAGADWVTALPGQWDAGGRLVLVQPSAWYPRLLIRQGLFTGRGLGWIQQESTSFTRRLLDRAAPEALSAIRGTKMAGDFLLWREFARHARLVAIPTVLGGFRAHGGNASVTGLDRYYREIAQAGIFVPPALVGRLMRMLYRLVACLATARLSRRVGIELERSRLRAD
jgi:glycosyltransferase involved in cell wall biosynthesis